MNAIDLFAGWGGFTEGATQAGARVVWAANHWPVAVAAHAANHPTTEHACQDVTAADWSQAPAHDLLLASPPCPGHSTASQPKRRPYHDKLRGSAWAVVDAAAACRPKALIVENVPGFLRWDLLPSWIGALTALGYTITTQIVHANEHGVPQLRKRAFVVGIQGRTFAYRPPSPGLRPAISSCIAAESSDWRPIHTASAGARVRMRAAQRLHGHLVLSQHVTGHTGVPLSEPIRTITGQDHWILANHNLYRPLSLRELAAAMGFPPDYQLPQATRADSILGLGNAVCPPVARDLVRAVMEQA